MFDILKGLVALPFLFVYGLLAIPVSLLENLIGDVEYE